jgi:hypothetical protein
MDENKTRYAWTTMCDDGAALMVRAYFLVLTTYTVYTRTDSTTPSVHTYRPYHSIRTAIQVG